MKGRTLPKSFFHLGTDLAGDRLSGYQHSKLLSRRYCDTLIQEDERKAESFEYAFDKSVPEWDVVPEEHYAL